jgi:Ca2+/Na+ antiporter
MKKLRLLLTLFLHLLRGITRFYPLQLPFFQLRRHPFLMAVWGIFWAMGLGFIGRGVGVEMIFLSPGEGLPNPAWGAFAWGIAYGIFTTAYHLSTFLLDAHHAGFLLHSRRNFIFLYALNNSLLPLAFLFFYLARYNKLHLDSPTLQTEILALLAGTALIWTLSLLYFSRWKLSLRALKSLIGATLPSQKTQEPPLTSGLWLLSGGERVGYYLTIPEGIVPVVRRIPHQAILRLMEGILTRGHLAALILEVIFIGLVFVWGYIQAKTDLYLPASVVVLIMGAITLMMMGALDYWLKRVGMGFLVFLALLSLLVWKIFHEASQASPAFGLSYEQIWAYQPPTWTSAVQAQITSDSASFAQVLQKRLARQNTPKPVFIWVTVSGGGWRSAYWTFLNLHLLDSLSGGRFYQSLAGITGASGGLIGATFWRELHLFHPHRAPSLLEAERLTQDLLNPLFSTGLLGLLSPNTYWEDTLTHITYPKGRDYAFETRLLRNTQAFHHHRLKDYAPYEESGQTPLIIFTPACLTNSLQLLISPLPLSFLCWADQKPIAIELRQIVPADDLWITSALRMNAAFPFILPAVRLPTNPPLDIIDAGAIDNLGQSLTLRLLWKQRSLLASTASKIIWIEIRDLPPPPTSPHPTSKLVLDKIGGLYAAFAESRYHPMSLTLEVLRTLYPIPIEKYTLHYTPGPEGYTPPLGFTLLPRDRQSLQKAAYQPSHLAHLLHILHNAHLTPY